MANALPLFALAGTNAESVLGSFVMVYEDASGVADRRYRATFRDPSEPRSILADFTSWGATDCAVFVAVEPDNRTVTFSVIGPPRAFGGRTGKLETELLAYDGLDAEAVARVSIDLSDAGTDTAGM